MAPASTGPRHDHDRFLIVIALRDIILPRVLLAGL
jgi:hypothetical protein